jgi:hypothetical protein
MSDLRGDTVGWFRSQLACQSVSVTQRVMRTRSHTHRFEYLLETPAGLLKTGFECECHCISGESVVLQGADDHSSLRKEEAGLSAELVVGPLEPHLPPGMKVDFCVAAIWRIGAKVHLANLRFWCERIQSEGEEDGGPSSGEGLDAIDWQVGDLVLSVGTEDGEYLGRRAAHADGMPSRLVGELHYGTVEYEPNSLTVPLSGADKLEVIEIQFIVAWAPGLASGEFVSTWFAVDQWHKFVRDRIGDTPCL